jgi:uncharacterized protein
MSEMTKFTTNNIFLDSSVLIEFYKQTKTELLETLSKESDLSLVVNSIVISEFSFHLLALKGNKAPLTLKVEKKIPTLIKSFNPLEFLNQFALIDLQESHIYIVTDFMEKYNLLPNDALILGTCKSNNIAAIASFDSDFEEPCKKENIILFKSVNDLKFITK